MAGNEYANMKHASKASFVLVICHGSKQTSAHAFDKDLCLMLDKMAPN
jgi:hypothetical protein